MALPQKVADRLQWEAPQTQGWSGRLIMFCATLFALVFAVWIGLRFGYEPYLQSQHEKKEQELNQFIQEVPAASTAKLFLTYSQVVNLKTLLAQHGLTSKLFTWLEENTQQNVYYPHMDFDGAKKTLKLLGFAKTNQDIEQQLQIFHADQRVRDMNLASVAQSNDGQGLTFDLLLTLNPSLLGIAPPKPSSTSPIIR